MALLVFSGCATCRVSKEQLAELDKKASDVSPVLCTPQTCPDLWDRAQVWLERHSTYKLQMVHSAVMETFNPLKRDSFDEEYQFSVTKEPLGNSTYSIAMSANCRPSVAAGKNWVPTGATCTPSPKQITAAFRHYLATGEDVLAGKQWCSVR